MYDFQPDIAVAILNWNGKKWMEKFMPLVLSRTKRTSIYFIDNHSDDDSVSHVKRYFPPVKVIQLDKNYGFAGGYNRALRQIPEKYVVLLNSDVEVTENWLPPLLERIKSDENIVAVQPKIKSFANKNRFEHAGAAGGFLDFFGYPYCHGRIGDKTEEDKGQYDRPGKVFWTSGACMLIDKDFFLESGGFDEHFFAHQEEIDWCWRANRQGKELWYEPASTVYHVGGGNLAYGNPFKTYLNFRNNLFMLMKNLPPAYLFPVILSRLVLDGIAGIKFLTEGKARHTLAIVKAHFSFYKKVPYYLKNRRKPYIKKYWEKFFFMWSKPSGNYSNVKDI